MTEQEWLACDNVEVMLSSLDGKASKRKVRLFAVACSRAVWHTLPDDWCTAAVELAERLADGEATELERRDAHAVGMRRIGLGDPPNEPLAVALGTLEQANPKYDGGTPLFAGAFATASAAAYASADACTGSGKRHARGSPPWCAAVVEAEQQQLAFLRDIFGPVPFRPITIEPAWQTPQVTSLARVVYDQRGFDRLPELAGGLEEVGCDAADLVHHLQSPGPHVRGCWAVDLLLGKA